ncbi:Fic/DOC family protein [Pseudolysinimonas sp.]|uniref:Fic/DOC family protein n=1 Tax=Pseudolysinimonas sp. TaxID=2680009 RepID=UPI0037851299
MTPDPPWSRGSLEQRWEGYFVASDRPVLRNKLGFVDADLLRDAENDFVEFRLAELREDPTLVERTYDLTHLCALHRQLFQDVYEWAGEMRTVGLAKGGGESFMPPFEIEIPMTHVAKRLEVSRLLRDIVDEEIVGELAYLYDYVNFAHPFREGNGRAQREFFAQLLAESDRGIDWARVSTHDLQAACHLARNSGDLAPLMALIGGALNSAPVYPPRTEN